VAGAEFRAADLGPKSGPTRGVIGIPKRPAGRQAELERRVAPLGVKHGAAQWEICIAARHHERTESDAQPRLPERRPAGKRREDDPWHDQDHSAVDC